MRSREFWVLRRRLSHDLKGEDLRHLPHINVKLNEKVDLFHSHFPITWHMNTNETCVCLCAVCVCGCVCLRTCFARVCAHTVREWVGDLMLQKDWERCTHTVCHFQHVISAPEICQAMKNYSESESGLFGKHIATYVQGICLGEVVVLGLRRAHILNPRAHILFLY